MSLVKFFKVQSQMTRRDEMTNHFASEIIKTAAFVFDVTVGNILIYFSFI